MSLVAVDKSRRLTMLFVVTHEHTPESCPADDPAPVHKMADENHIKESGRRAAPPPTWPQMSADWGLALRQAQCEREAGVPSTGSRQTLPAGRQGGQGLKDRCRSGNPLKY